ncbi:alpha/beta fold hydrolase [Propionibacteriaceae bacterium G1746]
MKRMGADRVVAFIHGLGDTPDAWAHQISELPAGFQGMAVGVPGLTRSGPAAEEFTLADASADLLAELDHLGIEQVDLCGLSLGAMIAFRTAVDHPERVRSLTLAAGQTKPPRALMKIQNALMRVLPERLVTPAGVSKARIAVVDAVAKTDFSGELVSITVPTLVLCGSRDGANLPAARALARGIPRAELEIIDGVGHQSNTQAPERFSAALNEFLLRTA